MKIRNGFVSNSSSSSFCIYGTVIDMDEIEKMMDDTEDKTEDEIVQLAKFMLDKDLFNEDDGVIELLDKIENKYGLSYYTSEDGECFIGRDFTSIRDDETGKEFKESTVKLLKSIFGNSIEIGAIEEVIHG